MTLNKPFYISGLNWTLFSQSDHHDHPWFPVLKAVLSLGISQSVCEHTIRIMPFTPFHGLRDVESFCVRIAHFELL